MKTPQLTAVRPYVIGFGSALALAAVIIPAVFVTTYGPDNLVHVLSSHYAADGAPKAQATK